MLNSLKRENAQRGKKIRDEILVLMECEIARLVRDKWEKSGRLDSALKAVLERRSDPYSVVQEILEPLKAKME